VALQHWTDMGEGEALRWAMFAATVTVMAVGTWLTWLASRTAARDVAKTMGEFFASYQAQVVVDSLTPQPPSESRSTLHSHGEGEQETGP
jgi:hypothetical protein